VSGGVERFGGFGVGVFIEEPVQRGQGVRVGFAQLPCLVWDRQGEAGGLPAAEADVGVDAVSLGQRDVVDEQPDHAFAFPLRGGRICPEGGEIRC
jgi:hypothetical protein